MSEYMEDPEVAARVRQSIAEGEEAMASGEPMVTLEDTLRAERHPDDPTGEKSAASL